MQMLAIHVLYLRTLLITLTYPMNLKTLKLLHHLQGKLKTRMKTATTGYVENSLVMSVSLLNSIDLHSFYILQVYISFISLLLCKYIIIIASYYLTYGFL